jgi:hypothetical protein
MEVPSESFCRSSWDSRTCYPWRATNQRLTDDWLARWFLNLGSSISSFLLAVYCRLTAKKKKSVEEPRRGTYSFLSSAWPSRLFL